MTDDKLSKLPFKVKVTYDDVLLVPKYSRVLPKSVDLRSELTPNIIFKMPIISSSMDTVTNSKMAIAMALNGCMGIIHKNQSIDLQISEIKKVKTYTPEKGDLKDNVNANVFDHKLVVGAAIGIGENVLWYAQKLLTAGVDVLCIDTAHAHTEKVIKAIKTVATHFPKVPLIAGNVATIDGAKAIIEAGANIIKIGIGCGTICTTRRVTGVGVPQFSAVYDIAQYVKSKYKKVKIIADGGIVHSGDIVKALGAGANFVMIGNLLAGTNEACSKTIVKNNQKYRLYEGMGSQNAMSRGSNIRYFHEKKLSPDKYAAEGVEGLVPESGSVKSVLYDLIGGVKSGFGYCGCLNIHELHEKAEFIYITSAGFIEGNEKNIIKL